MAGRSNIGWGRKGNKDYKKNQVGPFSHQQLKVRPEGFGVVEGDLVVSPEGIKERHGKRENAFTLAPPSYNLLIYPRLTELMLTSTSEFT